MDNASYKVVFEGDLIPGQRQDQVQKNMAKLFKKQDVQVAHYFSGQSFDVKRQLSFELAKKYVRAMAKIGALAYIQIQDADKQVTTAPDHDVFTETGSFSVEALTPKEPEQEAAVSHDDTTVPVDMVGALTSNAFATFFERQAEQRAEAAEEEPSDAHAIILDDEPVYDEAVVTDNKNVIDMRKLASMVKRSI